MTHIVRTTHIQRLIKNAAFLAGEVDGMYGEDHVNVPDDVYEGMGQPLVHHALCKAISDLRHAADELDAERLSCFGWRQV